MKWISKQKINTRTLGAVGLVFAIAAIGAYMQYGSSAATAVYSREPENGTFSGTALIDDVNASGGKAVQFVSGAPSSDPLADFWAVGLSSSRSGLGGSDAEYFERLQEMSSASGIPLAQLKSKAWTHKYNTGINWDAGTMGAFQTVAREGLAGIVLNQKPGNLQVWANGGFDNEMQAYVQSVSRWTAAHNTKAILILHHEPEDDTTVAEAVHWRAAQARWMKIVADHNDPTVIASVNWMPYTPPGRSFSEWDPLPDLLELVQNNTQRRQAILERTLIGFDPYPEFSNRTPLQMQFIDGRAGDGYSYFKARGAKYFFMPEVGLFHWKHGIEKNIADGVVPFTDLQQAQRLYDELWTNAKAKGYVGFMYFDVSDWNAQNYRGGTRELGPGEILADGTILTNSKSPQYSQKELAEYARLIMGANHSRPQ